MAAPLYYDQSLPVWLVREAGPPYGLTGRQLLEIHKRPRGTSPIPGVLPDEPGLGRLIGESTIGKTRFGVRLGVRWSLGLPAWPGQPPLPGSRTLFVEAEENGQMLTTKIEQYAAEDDIPAKDAFDRVSAFVLDPLLSESNRSALTLNEDGVEMLRRELAHWEGCDDRVGFVLIDSQAAAKPPEYRENEADGMREFYTRLRRLAYEFQCYVVMVVHTGRQARRDPIDAGRGTSDMGAAADWSMLFLRDSPDDPKIELRVRGNSMDGLRAHWLQTSDGANGRLDFVRPTEPGRSRTEGRSSWLDQVSEEFVRKLILEKGYERGDAPGCWAIRTGATLLAEVRSVIGSVPKGNNAQTKLATHIRTAGWDGVQIDRDTGAERWTARR